MTKHEIKVDTSQCVGCGMCVKDCPTHRIKLEQSLAVIQEEDCVLCGHCEAICPRGAIIIYGFDETSIPNPNITLHPDEVLNVIRFRRSIRQFQDKEIPKEIIEQILEAGRLTHTAKNMQDVSFYVLDRELQELEQTAVSLLRKVKPIVNVVQPMARKHEIHDHFFFFDAPKVIVIAAKSEINGALAAQNMEFVAEANGLGVLFSGYFTMAANISHKIKKILGIPKGKKAITTLVLGYPKVHYRRSAPHKSLDVKYL